MENASKALIMAGSVLISLLIIGALLLMFNNLSSYQETDAQSTIETEVLEFNSQYETYNRENVRGSDLYSLLSKVIDYNKRKSTKGDGRKDEGKFLSYMPMTIYVEIGKNRDDFYASTDKGDEHIIWEEYTQSGGTGAKNEFEDKIYSKIQGKNGKEGIEEKLRRKRNSAKLV